LQRRKRQTPDGNPTMAIPSNPVDPSKSGDWPEDAGPYPQRSLDGQEGGSGRSVVFAALSLGLHTILLGGTLAATLIVGPRCEKVLRDFNMRPTTVAVFALGVSHWLSNYWFVLVIFLVPCFLVDGILLFLLHRERRTRRRSYVWALVVLLLIVLFSGCLGGSLFTLYSQIAGMQVVFPPPTTPLAPRQ
jgi:hypothetical protein